MLRKTGSKSVLCVHTKITPLLGSNFSETQPLIFKSVPLQTPNARAHL